MSGKYDNDNKLVRTATPAPLSAECCVGNVHFTKYTFERVITDAFDINAHGGAGGGGCGASGSAHREHNNRKNAALFKTYVLVVLLCWPVL